MTVVTFSSQGSRLVGFEVKGHSGYAGAGEDIVCAAVTSAVRLVEATVNDVMGPVSYTHLGLPCFDGYHWCTEIRRVSRVPVIFISSAADNMNIIMAMNLGAADFIAKPCLLYTSRCV